MSTIIDRLSSLTLEDRTRAYVVAGYLATKDRCQRSPLNPTPRLQKARQMPAVTLYPDFDLQATKHPPTDLNIRKRL